MKRTYRVVDEAGLHARPASLLAQVAGSKPNDVFIEYNDKSLTLKSIMVVMSLGVPYGAEFTIAVSGDDANDVLDELEAVLVEHKVI